MLPHLRPLRQHCVVRIRSSTICRCRPTTGSRNIATATEFGQQSTLLKLQRRDMIQITGSDKFKFLQGLCSNQVSLLKETKSSIAAAFFTNKGRVLAPALLHFHGRVREGEDGDGEDGGSILIDSAPYYQSELEQHLRRFKLRAKVSIRRIATDRYFMPAQAIVPASLVQKAPPPDQVFCSSPDPRSDLFGYHILTLA
eukprot:gene35941-48348_t